MAIAGLPNVPIHESQSSSSGRRRSWGSISTRTAETLRKWRQLEEECAMNHVRERERPRFNQESNDGLSTYREGEARDGLEENESENGSVINSESQMERLSFTSEQSQDLGEVETKEVRKIFQERTSSVRVVRDWIEMTSQQREACVGSREDQVAEIASQFEQAGNGQVNEGQPENSRRQIRKLCGRQALLDLLVKKQHERKEELQRLKGDRPVSDFAHRKRIQSLLRLRCFQNRRRSTELRRPSSAAESELGLLRQRQTVADLREGFMSRLDNNINVQATDASEGSSGDDSDAFIDDQSQANGTSDLLYGAPEVLNVSHEENDLREVDVVPSTLPLHVDPGSGPSDDLDQRVDIQDEVRLECNTENIVENRPETATSIHNGSSDDGFTDMNSQESPRSESEEFNVLEERHDIVLEDYSDREEVNVHNELDDQVDMSENLDDHDLNVPEEDWQEQDSEYGREWENSPLSEQWRDDPAETDTPHWPGDGEDHFYVAVETEATEGGEQIDQDDFWPENGSQETPRDWLGINSSSRWASNRGDTYSFSDDGNVYQVELRDLVNQRPVSSLLRSDFRESLDRLIQSYAERQTNAPDNWEFHEMLPPPFRPRNQERLHTVQEEFGPNDPEEIGSERAFPPAPPPPPQGHLEHGMHQTNLGRQETLQRRGTKWEIINDLRIDMAKLQQRMNNMQSILEACMDMQLELQRSVRQEVSAALNRSVNSSDLPENILPKESFKWDSVRKGLCCICSNTNVDSLLYRCGHMCTCTKCADVLLKGNGKCPMCQAPVIEVIRAYFIQ